MGPLPHWQSFEGHSPETLLADYPFWSHLTPDERASRHEVCSEIRAGEPEVDSYTPAAMAAMRLDIQEGVYEPYLWGDLLREYWYGPNFTPVPYVEDIDFDASGDFLGCVGQLANWDEPPWVLAKAANTENENQRIIVARNLHTPPPVLSAFAEWELGTYLGGVIAFYVGMNPSTPQSSLSLIAQRHLNIPAKSDQAETFGTDLLSVVLMNPNCPLELIENRVDDIDPLIRQSISINPATPAELLRELAHDRDEAVAAAARANPVFVE